MDFIQVDELGQPYYLIKYGDTLSKLAAKTGFTVPEIADCNHITNANNLRMGQKILFPENGPTVTNPNRFTKISGTSPVATCITVGILVITPIRSPIKSCQTKLTL